jgi:hypothetical protein
MAVSRRAFLRGLAVAPVGAAEAAAASVPVAAPPPDAVQVAADTGGGYGLAPYGGTIRPGALHLHRKRADQNELLEAIARIAVPPDGWQRDSRTYVSSASPTGDDFDYFDDAEEDPPHVPE